MSRRLIAGLIALFLAATVAGFMPTQSAIGATQLAATGYTPEKLYAVTAKPGPGVGQITIAWQHNSRHTTYFRIETALTPFSPTNTNLPKVGRNPKKLYLTSSKRSVTLSAAQVAAAGAGAGTGYHLYYRLYAVNHSQQGYKTRGWGMETVLAKPVSPKSSGTVLRAASFNIRTARATSDARSWLDRAPDVAHEILSRNPGVVAIQELSPGRADGGSGSTKGRIRQTDSLESALRAQGGSRYQLVRTTAYIGPNVKQGTQGARILYDSSRYGLKSACPDSSSGGNYSATCTIVMPLMAGDSEDLRRRATYAEFADLRTGKRFFMVSAHLDQRHSANLSTERRLNVFRDAQVEAVVNRIASINTAKRVVVFGGDINSWQSNQGGNGGHDRLIRSGFYDSAAALTRINLQYSTVNHFDTTILPNHDGFGARFDVVMVKGVQGAKRFENVTRRVDSARPSDHNMVVADLVL